MSDVLGECKRVCKSVNRQGTDRKHVGRFAGPVDASGMQNAHLKIRTPERPKTPGGVSYVWQTQGLETRIFGSVAMVGLTGEFPDVWQGKKLGDGGKGMEVRPRKELRGRRC